MKAWISRALGTLTILASVPAGANAPVNRYTFGSGTVYDTKTKLTWQQTLPTGTFTWAQAAEYCTGVGTTLSGTGWRLPTAKELYTIVDLTQTSAPLIDTAAFPQTPAAAFWSVSAFPANAVPPNSGPVPQYTVSFADGSLTSMAVTALLNVRCVRTGT